MTANVRLKRIKHGAGLNCPAFAFSLYRKLTGGVENKGGAYVVMQ